MEGTYLLVSPPLVNSGLPLTMTPTCGSGPCTTKITYSVGNGGAKGSGVATWDGKAYTATDHETLGCQINGVVVDPAAAGTVTLHFQVASAASSDPIAQRITGAWSGTYHLVGKAIGHPGCNPTFAFRPFTATRQ